MTPLFSQAPAGSSPGPAPARQSNSISSWNVVETGADRRVSRLAASPLGVIPPSPKGPRSYARKASPLYAGQVGNPDCPVYGTIPRGEQQTVPYVGQSPCRRAEELCSESIPPLRRTGRESGLSRIWDDPPGRATNCPICGTIPLAEGPECSIWGDNLHRREIGAFRSPDAVLQHIAIYFTPKGETHDGLLPASSTHGS
jgi:hypothetical protein